MKLKDKIKNYIENIEHNPFYTSTDNTVRDDIIQILHDHFDGNLLQSFLVIEQLNKEKLQREKDILYRGLEDGMHGLVSVCKHLLEDSNSKNAKAVAKLYFVEDNLAFLINIAKAYFPKGKYDGCSENGRWFLDNFKKLVREHQGKYLKGGSSYDWACNYDHINYIKLILDEDKGTDTI